MSNFLCGIEPGLLQWALGGTATALVFFGFALGVRSGFKMGKRERLTLDQLKDRTALGPDRRAAAQLPARWVCATCNTGNWMDVDRWNCRTCGAPRPGIPAA